MKIIFERKINYYETDKMGVVHHFKVFVKEYSKHCFTNKNLKPINLKKYAPEFNTKFENLM